jgi:Flp pilus assembly protein TadG
MPASQWLMLKHVLCNTQRGASVIEMALLLPLLVLMLDGVLELGLMLHNQSVLTSASSIAARAGITNSAPKLSATQITAIATSYCNDRLISLGNTPSPTVTVMQSPDPNYPNPLQVRVQYTFKGLIVGGLIAAFQSSPVLTATTVMYNE